MAALYAWLALVAEKLGWRVISALSSKIWKWITSIFAKKEQDKKNKENTSEFDKIVTDPAATRDDRRKGEDDFINS